ncbi:protein N-terminal glutamine amidohydrolase isoform X2 [Corythoichthys intestinalis]|uniref:protein N-terminal glutamine amidohydrolase isoform X2 n=1 Tax=Corythoichthys intestinalis TaxID=161448 RepID=UPI0025A67685|nr:protein N-terminal glutamine amidohydrolase isoform X2 [Corythoichthys intestinalis]
MTAPASLSSAGSNMTEDRITPAQEECQYSSCYCEENVWKLCDFVRREGSAPLPEVFAVFISNDNRTVPLWEQKSACGERAVVWDYHVLLLHARPCREAAVYDLDSALPFPCGLKEYAARGFRPDDALESRYRRKLRAVPADVFLSKFASDRSHMKNADGSWRTPPPPYPPISVADCSMNLDDFICMEPTRGWGQVFTLEHFLRRYLTPAPVPSLP